MSLKVGIDARNLVHSMAGIGRYVFEMSRALAALGAEVILYLPSESTLPPEDLAFATLRCSRCSGAVSRIVWGQTILPEAARRDKVEVFWGPSHRLPGRLDNNIPRVLTIHDLVWVHAAETMSRKRWLAERMLMGPAIKDANRIVAISQATADALNAYYPNIAGKLRVVYNGLTSFEHDQMPQDQVSALLARLGIAQPFILFVGTLEPRKNLLRLLDAYSQLPENICSTLHLVIAGGKGWKMKDLSGRIAELGISRTVIQTGYISNADLAALYRNAYVLAMPSLYEGFGLPIIEANSVGVPVLTSNVSSMPEVAGDAAILVDPLDSASISAGLLRLAADRPFRDRLAGNARANAARFNWNKSAAELLDIFQDAMRTIAP